MTADARSFLEKWTDVINHDKRKNMTADQSPTAADHRAAGVEKMARAIWEHMTVSGLSEYEAVPFEHLARRPRYAGLYSIVIRAATAALAAWERHCSETQKAPDG